MFIPTTVFIIFDRVRDKFFAMVDSGMKNWDDRESRDILRSVLMTTCDVAAITKPWKIQRKVKENTLYSLII